MTTENKAPVKELTPVQILMRDVSDNPANVKWPADRWGLTTEIRKAILNSGGRVCGNADKHDILLNTLAVAIAHVQKRRKKDVEYALSSRAGREAAQAERIPRQRVSAGLVRPE